MSIEARFKVSRPGFTLDFESVFPAQGLTALFGPSGSGKTTVLRCIAGLNRVADAYLTFGDEVWQDGKTWLPTHRRGLAYVFQEASLFPHLSVSGNLLYGARGDRRSSGQKLGPVVELLGIEKLLNQRPATLSGGEKQRVAIGRALLSAPRLILMDEPLSALDRDRRQEILPYIERIRDEMKIPVIYVSHALDEVARLATKVVLIEEGRVRREGSPQQVFPELSFGLDGVAPQSILEARIVGHEARYGLSMAEIGDSIVTLQPVDLPEDTMVRIRVPATDVMIALERHADLSALNQLPGTLTAMKADGHHVLVTVDCYGQRLLARVTLLSAERLGLRLGLSVHALFKAVSIDGGAVYRAPDDQSARF